MLKVLVCGDRNWTNYKVIYTVLATLPKDTIIIHGANGVVENDCVIRGADKMAAECALELGLQIDKPPTRANPYGGYPYRGEFGRAGGAVRNQQMLDEAFPDEVWCFHNNLTHSKGSRDMVDRARNASLPVKLFTEDWPTGAWLEMPRSKELQDELFAQARERFVRTYTVLPDQELSAEVEEQIEALHLPDHAGTCECEACDSAYGKRR